VGGIMALFSPTLASNVVLGLMTFGMIVIGILTMLEVFTVKYLRGPALIGGFTLVVLGFLMATNATQSLVVITVAVAAIYMCAGIFRVVLARRNPEMQGYMPLLVSGIFAIVLSLILILALPRDSEYTVGILLGVNWVVHGAQRIALGLKGRATANAALAAANSGEGGYENAP
jgi:uncharacterized membrane protein HdeD (DUF308 family)